MRYFRYIVLNKELNFAKGEQSENYTFSKGDDPKNLIKEKLKFFENLPEDTLEDELDEKSKDVLKEIIEKFDNLPVDFILESLTKLWWAPTLMYDDEGSWALDCGGVSSIRTVPEDDYGFSTNVEAKFFKPTIREAVKYYLIDALEEV